MKRSISISFEYPHGFDWSGFNGSLHRLGGKNWQEQGFFSSIEFTTKRQAEAFLRRATELANTHGIEIVTE